MYVLKKSRYFIPIFEISTVFCMKKYLLFVFLTISVGLFAQQEPQFSQYMFSNLLINPGYAGIDNSICVTLMGRQQWLGFKQFDYFGNTSTAGPQTFLLAVDAPVKLFHGGVGVTVLKDKLGFEDNIGAKISYSYHLNIGAGKLGIGINFGILNKTIDFSKLKPIDESDPLLLPKNIRSDLLFDLSAGLYYRMPDKFYVGLSTSQLIESKGKTTETATSLKRHYYITGGYEYMFPNNPSFVLIPSALIKTDFKSAQYDISTILEYNKLVWGGVSYRVQDAVMILLGMEYKNFNIGLSYDITTSAIGREKRSSGTLELMLKYCFKIVPKHYTRSYRNTRFLDDSNNK